MKRNSHLLIAAAGAGIAGYALKRAAGVKKYKSLPYGYGPKFKRAVTVQQPAAELYSFWRRLRNIPPLVDHIASVEELDDRRSHWTIQVPGGLKLGWNAEITVDRENEMIGWRTLDGSAIANAGYIRFERATGGRGTTVRVALRYNPPGGKAGVALASLLGEQPEGLVNRALHRFKQLAETGEVSKAKRIHERALEEEVEIASEDSFPASDAPAWTGTTGPTTRH